MTPREELLAAVAKTLEIIDRAPAYINLDWYRVIRDWLQLEADQHWHVAEPRDAPINRWDLVYKPEWVAMQPCIRMARLINGAEGP